MSKHPSSLEDIADVTKSKNLEKVDTSAIKLTSRRVAILYVHGQGEQAPLKDLRELAQVLWRKNTYDTDSILFAAPVDENGQSEQQMILTNKVTMKGPDNSEHETSVDFHQFYWADLVSGNRFIDFWAWLIGLMRKSPEKNEVPKALLTIRNFIMKAGFAIGLFGAIFGALTAFRFILIDQVLAWANLMAFTGFGLSAVTIFFLLRPKNRYLAFLFGMISAALGGSFTTFGAKAVENKTQLIECLTMIPRAELQPNANGAHFQKFVNNTNDYLENAKSHHTILRKTQDCSANPIDAECKLANGEKAFTYVIDHVIRISDAETTFFQCKSTFGDYGVDSFRYFGTLGYQILDGINSRDAVDKPILWPKDKGAPKYFQRLDLKYRTFVTDLIASVTIIAALIFIALVFVRDRFLIPVMADSARLFSNSPRDVAVREAIRKRGLELLERLHKPRGQSGAYYDEIIIVAHSLGTAVAYGLLNHFWGTRLDQWPKNPPLDKALLDVTEAASKIKPIDKLINQTEIPETNDATRAFRAAQRRLFDELKKAPTNANKQKPWLISNFVTLGSPLTYASFLLSESKEEFSKDIFNFQSRAACPPVGDQEKYNFCVSGSPPNGDLIPRYSAMYCCCNWTNLYFKTIKIFDGDIIGGPLRNHPPLGLGLGILDIPLDYKDTGVKFAHTNYWSEPTEPKNQNFCYDGSPYLSALRVAVGLGKSFDERENALLAISASHSA